MMGACPDGPRAVVAAAVVDAIGRRENPPSSRMTRVPSTPWAGGSVSQAAWTRDLRRRAPLCRRRRMMELVSLSGLHADLVPAERVAVPLPPDASPIWERCDAARRSRRARPGAAG